MGVIEILLGIVASAVILAGAVILYVIVALALLDEDSKEVKTDD